MGRNPSRLWRKRAMQSAALAVMVSLPSIGLAQSMSFNIQAQPLAAALRHFANQTGRQVAMDGALVAAHQSPAILGQMEPEAALNALLAGTGLTYRISPDNSIAILAAQSSAVSGHENLGQILLSAPRMAWDGTEQSVYEAAGDVDFIAAEELQKLPVTSVGDILRSTTGVLSGDSRSSGALNVNIHGMQGQGRVPVTVDGAQNWATAYRGYQGNSDRSFVDPDFIGAVAISKGPQTSQNGIAGSVVVKTIGADDILREGENSGFRLRLSASGNSSSPQIDQSQLTTGSSTSSAGLTLLPVSRPSLLEPTAGGASLAWATRGDWGELVAGYSYRRQGNYHAGTDGPSAAYAYLPCEQVIGATMCPFVPNQWGNQGLSSYQAGEEVLNTSAENRSILLKAGINLNPDLRWDIGYNRYKTTFGEVFTREVANAGDRTTQRGFSDNILQSLTSELHYSPADSERIALRWKLWATDLISQSAPSDRQAPLRPTSENIFWGSELSNRSSFETSWGELRLDYGVSYLSEDTQPDDLTRLVARPGRLPDGSVNRNQDDGPLRDAYRREWAAWSNAELQITEAWQLYGGLRYTHSKVQDRSTHANARKESKTYTSFAPSIGTNYQLNDAINLYASYATAYRHPSLTETSLAYGLSTASSPEPEKARNLDLGVNIRQEGLWGEDDQAFVKFGYFDNRIKDYIGRGWDFDASTRKGKGLYFYNMDQARFEGFYLSADYQNQGFKLGASATYYTTVEFCPTADRCANRTSWADFASNHIPPSFQLALDVSQKLLQDRLTLGARLTHVGARAAGNEGSPPSNIYNLKMSMGVDWQPYTLVDLYGSYDLSETAVMTFGVQNVTDRYYIDPISTGRTPAPGRMATLGLEMKF